MNSDLIKAMVKNEFGEFTVKRFVENVHKPSERSSIVAKLLWHCLAFGRSAICTDNRNNTQYSTYEAQRYSSERTRISIIIMASAMPSV